MTAELAKAFEEAARLPENEQEALAALLLEELASQRRWDDAFERSQDKLADMADKTLADYHNGSTAPLG